MLLEPPGPHVPAGRRLSRRAVVDAGRLAAGSAALVLAATSRGDAIVLGALLLVAAARPAAVVAVTAALAASSLRWGATSLEALSGAQAVLGPAGWVGPTSAAVGSWLAGAALLVALARRSPRILRRARVPDLVLAGAVGASVAAVVAGPAPGGAVWLRVVAGVLATVLALALGAVRLGRRELGLVLDVAAGVAGLAALVAVRAEGGGWSGMTEAGLVGEGLAISLAVAVAVLGARGALALRARARWSPVADAT